MVGAGSANVLGFIGVSLLLVAFFLNLVGLIMVNDRVYIALNFVGASLSCVSSYLVKFVPFVILEGTWAVVAGIALIRVLIAGRSSPTPGE
jgi:hypothetical protein